MRKKTRRWHAVVAGAIAGGLAILFERSKGGRRTVIAQQLFVRFVLLSCSSSLRFLERVRWRWLY